MSLMSKNLLKMADEQRGRTRAMSPPKMAKIPLILVVFLVGSSNFKEVPPKAFIPLFRLVLTLSISTVITERAFSAMNLVKTKLRNKMVDYFLSNYLITYIEKEIVQDFDTDSIEDEFYCMKERRAQHKMPNLS